MICKHNTKIDSKNYDEYCIDCHIILSTSNICKHDDEIKRNHHYIPLYNKEYDRAKWNGNKLEYIRGDFNNDISDQCKLFIMEEIPDPFTWYDVSKTFLKYKLPDYWLGFGKWLGPNYHCKLNRIIVNMADEYTQTKLGNYRVNYCYILYKLVQLFGNEFDARLVPMKGKAIWLYRMDKWWEKICEEKNYEFKVSIVYKFHWNKKQRIQQFQSCINEMAKIKK